MYGLDRYITGNWGEDSVPPEFFLAKDLGDQDSGAVIDIGLDGGIVFPVRIDRVEPYPGGYWLAHIEDVAFPVLIKADDTPIYYSELPDEER